MTQKLVTVDLLLDDSPREWEAWPLSRKMKAVARDEPAPNLNIADRVEMLVVREDKSHTPLVLSGFLISQIQPEGGMDLVVIECNKIGPGHDMSGLMAIAPSSAINRVVSVLVQETDDEPVED
jgi:hypothetical protein